MAETRAIVVFICPTYFVFLPKHKENRPGGRAVAPLTGVASFTFISKVKDRHCGQLVRNLIERLPIAIIALDMEAAVTAARMRAQHVGLRLPDALVIATAAISAAEQLITTDHKWPTAKTMKIKPIITRI